MKNLLFNPELGMQVIATGKITTWSKYKTTYQLDIDKIELEGEGALLKLIEDRKKKLKTTSLNTTFKDDSGKNIDIDVKDLDKTPGEEAIHKQKILLVRKFVSKLPDKYENLIKYRYFEELSYNEIAEKTKSPLGTIKAQLFRARELLFEILKDKKSQI